MQPQMYYVVFDDYTMTPRSGLNIITAICGAILARNRHLTEEAEARGNQQSPRLVSDQNIIRVTRADYAAPKIGVGTEDHTPAP